MVALATVVEKQSSVEALGVSAATFQSPGSRRAIFSHFGGENSINDCNKQRVLKVLSPLSGM